MNISYNDLKFYFQNPNFIIGTSDSANHLYELLDPLIRKNYKDPVLKLSYYITIEQETYVLVQKLFLTQVKTMKGLREEISFKFFNKMEFKKKGSSTLVTLDHSYSNLYDTVSEFLSKSETMSLSENKIYEFIDIHLIQSQREDLDLKIKLSF